MTPGAPVPLVGRLGGPMVRLPPETLPRWRRAGDGHVLAGLYREGRLADLGVDRGRVPERREVSAA